jgi:hypothetical protein
VEFTSKSDENTARTTHPFSVVSVTKPRRATLTQHVRLLPYADVRSRPVTNDLHTSVANLRLTMSPISAVLVQEDTENAPPKDKDEQDYPGCEIVAPA